MTAEDPATTGTGSTGAAPARFPIASPPSRPAIVAAIGIAAVLILCYLVGEALATFVIGLILILVLDPLVTWLADRGIRRAIAAVLSIALLAIVLIVFAAIVIGASLKQGPAFVGAVVGYVASARESVLGSDLPGPVKDAIETFFVQVKDGLAGIDVVQVVEGVASTIFGIAGPILGFVLVLPFFMFYVLSDRPRLVAAGRRSIPAQWRGDVLHVVGIGVDSFTTYIRAEALLMVLLGAITFVGLMILSVLVDSRIAGYALFLAVIAAFSELIPSFGPIIALVPALLFTASLGPAPLVAVLLLYLVIMFVEGNVLVPRIEGGRFELHPAIVIVLVLAGLALLGPLGAILAMPVTSAGRDVFRYAFARASGMPQPVVDDGGRIVSGPAEPAITEPGSAEAAGPAEASP